MYRRSSWVAWFVILVISGWSSQGNSQIVVHETFRDGNLTDNQPAEWSLYCFQEACKRNHPEVEYSTTGGELTARFNDFAMWRLVSVNGTPVAPSDVWSIRARIERKKEDVDRAAIVGVGLDAYFWAGSYRAEGATESPLSAGQLFNAIDDDVLLPFYSESFVQLDVYPDHIEASSWLVDEPENVVKVEWNDVPTIASLPVIWGNFGGTSVFREVVVAKDYLGVGGDFDRNDQWNVADVDALVSAIRSGANDPRYNLTPDFVVDGRDLEVWIHQIKKSYLGDADLNGVFDSSDLTIVFQAGEYEDSTVGNSTWSEGDWDANGDFDSSDLVSAFRDGGYEAGPRAAVAVPEPSSAGSLALLLGGLASRVRRTGARKVKRAA